MNENIKLEFVTNNIKKIDKIIKNKSKIGIVFKDRYSLTSKMNLSKYYNFNYQSVFFIIFNIFGS
jgi:hypothetical protein